MAMIRQLLRRQALPVGPSSQPLRATRPGKRHVSHSQSTDLPVSSPPVHQQHRLWSHRQHRQQSQWSQQHTGYQRTRHSKQNRNTGLFFFVLTSAAGVVSALLMANAIPNVRNQGKQQQQDCCNTGQKQQQQQQR